MKNYLITTPIYYVNDRPHIGHAYTTIACDAYARFQRQHKNRVLFSTGTDEHGQKVEKSAANLGKHPQEFVDDISQHFYDLVKEINASPDTFIRTTQPHHKEVVLSLWNRLVERGQIYLGTYGGWYAIKDECYYSERELIDGKAPTGAEVEWIEEPSYFFKLSEWQEPLLKFYEDNPDFILPHYRANEIKNIVKNGLSDLSISRVSTKWGIQVPNDPEHVIYVWLDALTNYLTVGAENWNNYDRIIHVVGKDITKFHAVFWPAFLLAADLRVPDTIFAHGWWTNNGAKIGKSAGNAVDINALIHKYGVDTIRYFLLREIPFGDDGDFSEDAVVQRYNNELANNLGNLLNRTLTIIHKNFGGNLTVPTQIEKFGTNNAYLDAVTNLGTSNIQHLINARNSYSALNFRDVLEHTNAIVSNLNKFFTDQQPWVKSDHQTYTLYVVLNGIKQVAQTILPIIPEAANKIIALCGADVGKDLPTPYIVFPRF